METEHAFSNEDAPEATGQGSDHQITTALSEVGSALPAPLVQWTMVDLIIIGLASLAVSLLAILVMQEFTSPEATLYDSWPVMLVVFGQAVGLVASFVVLGMMRRKVDWMTAGFQSLKPVWWIIGAALSLGILPFRLAVGFALMLITDFPFAETTTATDMPFPDVTLAGAVFMTLVVGIIVPVGEEMIFRGVLYRWLRNHMGMWTAALISGAIFGLAHGYLPMAAAAFMLGVVMALAYEYTRSLWMPIIIHAVNNTLIFVMVFGLLLLVKWMGMLDSMFF